MKSLITITFSLFFTALQAQRICGSVAYTNQLVSNNPSLQRSIAEAEEQIQTTLKASTKNHNRDTTANEIINIPVVIHVLYHSAQQNISDAQIRSQIVSLNKDFSSQNADRINTPAVFKNFAADSRIQFCLAQVDPQGHRTTGIIRKHTNSEGFIADDAMKNNGSGGDNAWDSKKYLNIWVCYLVGRSLGYATPPGGPADKDGVVIGYDVFGTTGNLRAPFDKGRTASHEVGHWLGLKHIWGDDNCGDDGVDDTPRQRTYNFGCPSFPHVTSCSPDNNGDMFMNFMDFSDDACMNMFTIGQKKRMRALFAEGNLRNSFLNSFACDSTLAQAGPLPTDEPSTVADQFKIYPNPVQSLITVEYKPAKELVNKSITIYNTVGVIVFKGTISKLKGNFDLTKLISGVYIVKIGEGQSSYSTKLFKL